MKKKHIIPAIFGGIIGGIAGYTGAKFFSPIVAIRKWQFHF